VQWLTDYWSCTAFCCDSFSLLRQLCTVGHWIFYMAHVNNFVSEINNAYFSRHLFENNVWVAKSCVTVCFTYSSKVAILNTDILQGSLTTREGCGEVFKYDFVTNFLLSLTVKGFRKSVNIWWSYGQESGVLFFWLTVYFQRYARGQTDRQYSAPDRTEKQIFAHEIGHQFVR